MIKNSPKQEEDWGWTLKGQDSPGRQRLVGRRGAWRLVLPHRAVCRGLSWERSQQAMQAAGTGSGSLRVLVSDLVVQEMGAASPNRTSPWVSRCHVCIAVVAPPAPSLGQGGALQSMSC